ncbi:hypothetical protein FFLO_01929 [Filobasidium floriforme]|uniref:Mitochondrial import inner membrane translocase subunit n=1 Tax=Filobasidium floriforme TaxID=5210 RepID=A0A8K0JPV9_9TREE|nr:hypothetical protein FFLO_01929 [Filobasidium floriforme]
MSFFGLGGQQAQSQGTINPAQIEMAVTELDMITDVFNRLVNSCHAKCISEKYLEGDLNKGEGVCIDRCTAKFFEVSLGGCPLCLFSFGSLFPPIHSTFHHFPLQNPTQPAPGRTELVFPTLAQVRTPPSLLLTPLAFTG